MVNRIVKLDEQLCANLLLHWVRDRKTTRIKWKKNLQNGICKRERVIF